ncbi:MAG: ClpXP protease specificity-enhancing factor [Burkholderiaceae bacterium]|nr:ClpXP protease specificity-enhancing factor [Burkholderiaceae bacterium]
MTPPTAGDPQGSSTRPYLLRALHEWCTDNGFTPYVAVHVDASVQVPAEYVKNGEIVLNIGFEATANLELGNDFIRFRARFGGAARDIVVPVDHVVAIYARENGQGMAFPMPAEGGDAPVGNAPAARTELRLARPGDASRPPVPAAPRPLPTVRGGEPPDDGGPGVGGAGGQGGPGAPGGPGGVGKRPRLKRVK